MLTQNQEKYLLTIPEDKVVKIFPYNSKAKLVAEEIISKIKETFPELEILFIGAAALGISGQDDLDINILSTSENFDKQLPGLVKIFGEPIIKGTSIKWSFEKEGYEVELYLTDKESVGFQEQLKVFDLLKNNVDLLKEYEELKSKANGVPFREYQRRKYEFYNRILLQ
ncbi:MAG: GrpB family protein [Patescibacteria group bacterium]|nr:GrpB family protein [Patescibacteria group bacterium]